MAQINLHVTPEFEEALEALIRARSLRSKSEAIRHAVQEAAAPYLAAKPRDFSLLQGLLRRHAGTGGVRRRPVAELEREIDDEMDNALAPRRKTARKRVK
jgi:Arc/MetJ-type ribon-helix-helix transcriptional regulator